MTGELGRVTLSQIGVSGFDHQIVTDCLLSCSHAIVKVDMINEFVNRPSHE